MSDEKITGGSDAFWKWALPYLRSDDKGGQHLTTAYCPLAGCGKALGHVWRHPEHGLVFESVIRESQRAKLHPGWRDVPGVADSLPNWRSERMLWPLTTQVVVTATCTQGHVWLVDMDKARKSAEVRRKTPVEPLHTPSDSCGHRHVQFVTAVVGGRSGQ